MKRAQVEFKWIEIILRRTVKGDANSPRRPTPTRIIDFGPVKTTIESPAIAGVKAMVIFQEGKFGQDLLVNV
ncbi:MAG: hypothetical protein U1F77_00430 [Kiritimatiellia bacterium]